MAKVMNNLATETRSSESKSYIPEGLRKISFSHMTRPMEKERTSREQPKSALYPRLKIVKVGLFRLCETPVGCKI